MNKTIIFVLLSLFTSICFANDVVDNTIRLPKKFKRLSTFSGDLNDTVSFHLIFTKNKKNGLYTVHPYLFDGKTVEELAVFENEKKYTLVSFHKEDNILSLLLSFKIEFDDFIQRIDIDLTSKKVVKKDPISHDDFVSSFRKKNRTILIYKNKKKLFIKQFHGSRAVIENAYEFKGKKDTIKEFFKDNTIVAIKTDEFVKNGSIYPLKGYLNKEQLIFSKQNRQKLSVDILYFSLENKMLRPKIVQLTNNEIVYLNFKSYTTFVNGSKVYQLLLNRKEGLIKIVDFKGIKPTKTIGINTDLIRYIRGNTKFEGIEKYLKNATKGRRYFPSLTVNKTIDNKERIRVDYVDIGYYYNYNWWWHHHNFMQMQNFHNPIRTNIPTRSFGPNNTNDFAFETAKVDEEKRFFEFTIDENNELINGGLPETIYKEINKKEYIDKLNDIPTLRLESSCFLKNSFRYIGYNKDFKGFVIQTNKLK